MEKGKIAVVLGATGLVGGHLVNQLLDDNTIKEVKIFVRRAASIKHPKLTVNVVNFNNPTSFKERVTGDIVFSCMGTTIKTAGSQEAQYKVDYTYQFEFAQMAAENKVPQYFLVSSSGANSGSMFFYPRIKGQLEEEVKKLGFKNLVIVRPSLLVGERPEERMGEKFGEKFMNAFGSIIPGLKKYKPILGAQVASAMLNVSKTNNEAFLQLELDELFPFSTVKQ